MFDDLLCLPLRTTRHALKNEYLRHCSNIINKNGLGCVKMGLGKDKHFRKYVARMLAKDDPPSQPRGVGSAASSSSDPSRKLDLSAALVWHRDIRNQQSVFRYRIFCFVLPSLLL